VCLLPISSYYSEESPDWYRKVHTTPEDALIAAEELNCKVMVPWGYGNSSWRMGDRSSHSSLFRLLHMQRQLNSTTPLYVLNEGDEVSL
jgi:N-acyl-phosphatidylethanolamine-hydrolysing phospholipase D